MSKLVGSVVSKERNSPDLRQGSMHKYREGASSTLFAAKYPSGDDTNGCTVLGSAERAPKRLKQAECSSRRPFGTEVNGRTSFTGRVLSRQQVSSKKSSRSLIVIIADDKYVLEVSMSRGDRELRGVQNEEEHVVDPEPGDCSLETAPWRCPDRPVMDFGSGRSATGDKPGGGRVSTSSCCWTLGKWL